MNMPERFFRHPASIPIRNVFRKNQSFFPQLEIFKKTVIIINEDRSVIRSQKAGQTMSSNPPEIVFSCPIFKLEKTWQIGRSGKKHTRYVIRHPGGVGILPILPNGELLLIRQFRVAVGRFIYEIPAGMKEPGEDPLATAKRELKEETGYSAENWTVYPSFFASPGYLDEKLHLFLAENLTPGPDALEDGENLSVFSVPLDKALKMIDSGEIEDGKTVGAILRYALSLSLREKRV